MNATTSSNIHSLKVEAADLCMETLVLPPIRDRQVSTQGPDERESKQNAVSANEGKEEDLCKLDGLSGDELRAGEMWEAEALLGKTSWLEKDEGEEEGLADDNGCDKVGQSNRHCKRVWTRLGRLPKLR